MIKFLKHIWAGGWSVRLSFLVVFLFGAMALLTMPGPIIILTLVIASFIRLIKHFHDNDYS
jgi:hypothetical protein